MAEPARTASGRPRRVRRIDWFIPDPRAIINLSIAPGKPGGFHIPRSLARRLRANPFTMTSDVAFGAVIRACAEPQPWRDDTWLDDRLIGAYQALHRAGHAHSIEAWGPPTVDGNRPLLGGIYGVHIGAAFCAESMFCRPEHGGTDASKVCLAYLVRHLRAQRFRLLDVQIANRHTAQFGVEAIPSSTYSGLLAAATTTHCEWGVVNPTWREPTEETAV